MKLKGTKRALFLLRTYNDIDHIVPIIWKLITAGWQVFFVFVDVDYSEDYRIRFVVEKGAQNARSAPIDFYHTKLRSSLNNRILIKISDRLIAYSFGLYFLVQHRINVIASEWSGPFGRGRAVYFLRASSILGLPVYSVPHGYHIWLNPIFNRKVAEIYQLRGSFPDFSNRNWYRKYVVQSPEHKKLSVEYGMNSEKVVVLGSARFCEEWSKINYNLLSGVSPLKRNDLFTVLFFLPHWDYNVHRNSCLSILTKISNLESVFLGIKAHTRGTGALSPEERSQFESRLNVVSYDDSYHSTVLIKQADVVVNFGSSMTFEALRQGKPIINPTYLHDNQTFFDQSGVVFDTSDDESTLRKIIELKAGRASMPEQLSVDKFLHDRVDRSYGGREVLDNYLDLLSGGEVSCVNESVDM